MEAASLLLNNKDTAGGAEISKRVLKVLLHVEALPPSVVAATGEVKL